MSEGIILLNGIQFHHKAADDAINWASQSEAGLTAIIIRSGSQQKEGYIHDEPAKPGNGQERSGDEISWQYRELIQAQIQMLEHATESKGIQFRVEEMVEPTVEQVLEKTKNCTKIYADREWDSNSILFFRRFSLEDFKKRSNVPVCIS
jgi:hypothetical protein